MRKALIPLLVCALALAACGRQDSGDEQVPGAPAAAAGAGYASFATKNTTRIAGSDPSEQAAAVTQATFPGGDGDRPAAVAIVDSSDWRTAIAASVLAADPINAAILFSDGDELGDESKAALRSSDPRGSRAIDGAEVIRVGAKPPVEGRDAVDVEGADSFARAAAIDALVSGAASSDTVIVVGEDDRDSAMAAASMAAKTGAPIYFTDRDEVPAATREGIATHDRPQIVVLGSHEAVGESALAALRRLGTVVIAADSGDPTRASIEAARFAAGGFGWGIVDPGHGLVFARAGSPLTAAAAAPLSSSGTYGPLLLLGDSGKVPGVLRNYLLRIQPGYSGDPSRGVYNHGWIVGDEKQISASVQSEIDSLLEIERAR